MTWPIELTVPYPISVNRYWRMQTVKKNGQELTIPLPTTEGLKFKKMVRAIAITEHVRPIVGPVEYELELYPHRPQDWAKRAKADPLWWDVMTVQCLDLDNARKVLLDALNGVAWTDDSRICHDPAWRMPPDEHGERCVIRVKPYERAHPQLPLIDTQAAVMALPSRLVGPHADARGVPF
jgi:crossover junction endodeoxyribonuclease RusA